MSTKETLEKKLKKLTKGSIMKCRICDNKNTGDFIIIHGKKYHLSCIESLMNKCNKLNKRISYLERNLNKKENEELKKQLEEKDTLVKQCEISVTNVMDCYCERTDCSSRIKDSKKYDSLVQKIENQQQEFIDYLEDMLDSDNDIFSVIRVKDVLNKYKEIIGKDINVDGEGMLDENAKN